MSEQPITWPNHAKESAIREVHRLAERYLDGTVSIAVAADQRATTLSGMLGGAAVALLAAAAALLSAQSINWPLTSAALTMACSVLLASIACTVAARPRDFHVGGWEPKHTVRATADEMLLIRSTIEEIQTRIDFNRAALVSSARRTWSGIILAGLSLPVSAGAYAIARCAT